MQKVLIYHNYSYVFNSKTNKILPLSKLKAFARDNSNANQNINFICYIVENIVGKGENAGYQYFLLFPQCFHMAFSSKGCQKLSLCGERLTKRT